MDFTFGGIEAPVKGNEKRESNTVWCETIAFIAVPLLIWYSSWVSDVRLSTYHLQETSVEVQNTNISFRPWAVD